MRQALQLLVTALLATTALQAENMSFIQNERLKLGVDLDLGGAITFLASVKDGANVINNFDLGRQVQLSFYGGPVPFEAKGQKPAAHWHHIGWNPIQTGDDFKNASKVLYHENNGREIHLTCRPMQWPLNNVPGDCTFEVWLTLEGPVVKARARLNNAREDHTPYPARLQELPAVYANASFHRVISYQGDRPFTGAAVTPAPAPDGRHPWSFWTGTEGWAALLDESNHGLGLITPGRVHFTGGFAGKPGPNDTRGNSTGYLAGQAQEILDHDIVYEYHYELLLGSLDEIRQRAALHRPKDLPAWTFTRDRQGWHHQNARDTGWPIQDHLQVLFDKDDPYLISPQTFWHAEDAPVLILEAAFHTTQKQGVIMWQALREPSFGSKNILSFPLMADGEFHRHVIRLADHPAYRGGLIRLRLDPVGLAEKDAWMKVKSIRLARE